MVWDDFFYNNHWLSEFNCKIYDPEESQQFVSREIERGNITSLRSIPNHYSTRYTDVLTFHFLIIKDNENVYYTQNETKLNADEINTIRSWLESPKKPEKLSSKTGENESVINYYGIFTSINPFLIGQECFGLYLTFTCNSPYGFSNDEVITVDVTGLPIYSETNEELLEESGDVIIAEDTYATCIIINNSAEQNEFIKPIITIISNSVFVGETIEIQNVSDNNNLMRINLPYGKSSITIDCQKKKITDNNGEIVSLSEIGLTLPISDEYNYISAELYSFYWLQLPYGRNIINIRFFGGYTASQVKFNTRNIIKSGGF